MGCRVAAYPPQMQGQVAAGGGNTAGSFAAGTASAGDAAVLAAAVLCADLRHSLAEMQPSLVVLVVLLQCSWHCRVGAAGQPWKGVLHGQYTILRPTVKG